MDQTRVRKWTERYLNHYQCQIIESAPTYLVTQLSVQADKDILNRPFYWMYVEKMNIKPNPIQLCLIFDPENHPVDIKGEFLYFGAPRFRKMLESAQKHGKFVRLYELPKWQASRSPAKAYSPWLGVNYKISYICDQKKDRLCHLGISLLSGEVTESFYEMLAERKWSVQLPPNRHIPSQRLSLMEAVGELEFYLEEQIRQEDLTWAKEAQERFNNEIKQLDSYYPEHIQPDDKLAKEKKQQEQELVWQYHPRIEISVVNAGIFYLET
ncbi:MAG: YqhG family protein [Thermoactinomyces sp.]